MLRKARLTCRLVYEGKTKETLDIIKQIDDWQLSLIAPKNFDSQDVDNYIKTIELSFEALIASMEDLGVERPEDLTIFQFYTRLTYFEKKKAKQSRK